MQQEILFGMGAVCAAAGAVAGYYMKKADFEHQIEIIRERAMAYIAQLE